MKQLLSFLILMLLSVPFLGAQEGVFQKRQTALDNQNPLQKMKGYVKNIQTFNAVLPQEKVYLHFDNTSYFIGEHIWFKAYVVNPAENKPTQMSKILYVELLNEQGAILQTKKLKIDDEGQCHGDFLLNDSLFSGFYEVRAYTRYMLNFDQGIKWHRENSYFRVNSRPPIDYGSFWGNFNNYRIPIPSHFNNFYSSDHPYSRVFLVYSKPQTPGYYAAKNMVERNWTERPYDAHLIKKVQSYYPDQIFIPRELNIAFFPEGGNLIVGKTSRVALKATDEDGKELSIEGRIYDNQNNEVTQFSTKDRGMGVFGFTPQDINTYTAKVVWNNTIHEFPIQKAEISGYVFTLNPFTQDSCVVIQVEGTPQEQKTKLLGISIQCRGQVLWFDTLSMDKQQTGFLKIPHRILKSGVNECTLFDAAGRIYASRLFFVNKDDFSNLSLHVNNPPSTIKPLGSICLDFSLKGAEQKNLPVRFSVSVTDKATTEDTYHTDNIAVNLLLCSELKGYIPDPEELLLVNDRVHRNTLDLLMMIQGWRRYKWEYMSGTKPFKLEEPAEKQLSISGAVFGELDKKKQLKRYGFQPNVTLLCSMENNKGEMLLCQPPISWTDLTYFHR